MPVLSANRIGGACEESKGLHEILFGRSYRFLSKLSVDKQKGVLYNKRHQ